MTNFWAHHLAPAWRSVAIAASSDKERPALCRTVNIEQFPTGVRIVSTDSFVVLWSWVPAIADDLAAAPDLDEAPMWSAVSWDPWGRAKGLMAHAQQLATQAADAEEPPVEMTLRLGSDSDPRAQSAFAGLEATSVVIEVPGKERVTLRCFEGEFPSWRAMATAWKPEPALTIALAPDMAARLGKLATIMPGCRLGFSWGGTDGPAGLQVVDSDPHVEGLVCPCKWDFSTNRPAEEEGQATVADAIRDLADLGVTSITVEPGR
jgi:hypothetical protein